MTIKDIARPVSDHLEEFNKYFRESMKSDVSLLNLIVGYMTKKKGKRVRPLMVFLSSELCGGVNDRSYTGAAMVELLHNATLIHDDVVDEASERRGMASINATWNNKIAVLIGDYLLAKGLLAAVDNEEYHFLKALSDAVKRMSEGELLQIQKSKDYDTDDDIYYRIIADKTASLLSSCCEIGAAAASDDKEIHRKLRNYGEHIGIAFQIRDDIFDYQSTGSLIGKPVGNDLKEKKMTLPLIYSLKQAGNSERKSIIGMMKKDRIRRKNIKEIISFVKAQGGLEYAEKAAREYSDKAISFLADFEESEAKESLKNFASFVIDRRK